MLFTSLLWSSLFAYRCRLEPLEFFSTLFGVVAMVFVFSCGLTCKRVKSIGLRERALGNSGIDDPKSCENLSSVSFGQSTI